MPEGNKNRALGAWGEALACGHLKEKGYAYSYSENDGAAALAPWQFVVLEV